MDQRRSKSNGRLAYEIFIEFSYKMRIITVQLIRSISLSFEILWSKIQFEYTQFSLIFFFVLSLRRKVNASKWLILFDLIKRENVLRRELYFLVPVLSRNGDHSLTSCFLINKPTHLQSAQQKNKNLGVIQRYSLVGIFPWWERKRQITPSPFTFFRITQS